MNILNYLKKVNTDNLTNTEISDLQLALTQQLFFCDNPNKKLFTKVTHKLGFWYYGLNNLSKQTCQNKCRNNIDLDLAVTPEAKQKRKRETIAPEKKFPTLAACSEQGKEPIFFAKKIAKEFIDTFRYISIQKDNKTFFIQQNQKGTENYQTKKKWELIDFCKSADKSHGHCIFLTLTMAQKNYNGDFLSAWKPFSDEAQRFFNTLKHAFNCEYVWIKESTLKGYPHIHALIYLNEEIEHTFTRKKGKGRNYYISGGKWYDFLKANWRIGYFDSDINRRKNTYNYLVKYLAKSSKTQFKNLTKKGKISKEDVKDLLTVLCPIFCKVRGIGFSKMEIDNQVMAERAEMSKSLTEQQKAEREQKDFEFYSSEPSRETAKAYLKTLSIKSEISCLRKIGFYTDRTLESEFSDKAEWANKFSEERKASVHNKYAKSACNGCILTKLMDYYLEKDTSLFEKSCNLDLLIGIIHNANKQISDFEDTFQESWNDKKRFFFYIDALIKELKLKGSAEEINHYIETLFFINPLLWVVYLPYEVASNFLKLRLQVDRKAVEKYKNSTQYGKLTDMFNDFFLTLSASGHILK